MQPAAAPPKGIESVAAQQQYPRYKHHATKPPVIVKDAREEAALGEGWGDRPI